jgi:hypothetical protein
MNFVGWLVGLQLHTRMHLLIYKNENHKLQVMQIYI